MTVADPASQAVFQVVSYQDDALCGRKAIAEGVVLIAHHLKDGLRGWIRDCHPTPRCHLREHTIPPGG